jgi:NADH-quinone oxidoreductase subunit G
LLPGARPVTDAVGRAEVEAVWGAAIPAQPGRDVDAILRATADGSLAALVVGGVDPDDAADPACAHEALERAGFVVSLEVRRSAVTEHADVVLPVAPAVEKAGRYVDWEGRRRPFDLTITGTGQLPDARVLNALAEELDVDLNLPTIQAARDELLQLGIAGQRPNPPTVKAAPVAAPGEGKVLLATWHELLDAGRMQDGDDYLGGTAKSARAIVSPATAAQVGLAAGERVSVSTDQGVVVVPVEVAEMPDGVVWLPTNARDCRTRSTLLAGHGSTVTLTRSDAPPVVGVEEGE